MTDLQITQTLEKELLKRDSDISQLSQDLDKERDDKRQFYELIFNKSIQVLALIAVLFLIGFLINSAIGSTGEQSNGVYAVCGTLATFLRDFLSSKKTEDKDV